MPDRVPVTAKGVQMACMRLAIFVMIVLGAAHRAYAQQPAVVQLPSFSTFGVYTSVSVPDRGSISLGGVGRSSMGSTAFGPGFFPGNRSFGRSMSSSNTSLHATIHDFDTLDRVTLAQAHDGQPAKGRGSLGDRARRLAAAHESSAGRVPEGSVADARRQHAAEADAENAEAMANLKRARASVAAGKTNVAAMFYKVAAGHANGTLRQQIETEAARARAAHSPRVAHLGHPFPPRKATAQP